MGKVSQGAQRLGTDTSFRRILTGEVPRVKLRCLRKGRDVKVASQLPTSPHACVSQTPTTGPWGPKAPDTSEKEVQTLPTGGHENRFKVEMRPHRTAARDPSCRNSHRESL